MELLNSNNQTNKLSIIKVNNLNVVGKSNAQNHYLKMLQNQKIIFSIGPAGTGKTFLAVAAAVSQLLENKFDIIKLNITAV